MWVLMQAFISSCSCYLLKVAAPDRGRLCNAMKETDPFYKSHRWQKKRALILRRDGYKCQQAKRYGKSVQANTVHHVFPREFFPEYQWESWNLISLSDKEHNALHDRNTGTLTARGIELMERIGRRYNIDTTAAKERMPSPIS